MSPPFIIMVPQVSGPTIVVYPSLSTTYPDTPFLYFPDQEISSTSIYYIAGFYWIGSPY